MVQMSTSGNIAEFCLRELHVPIGTAFGHIRSLRKSGVLPPSNSGFGASKFSTSAGVDVMLSTFLGTNTNAPDIVRELRALPLTHVGFMPFDPAGLDDIQTPVRAAYGLLQDHIPNWDNMNCLDAGKMLDALVDAKRCGVISLDVTAEFTNGTNAVRIFIELAGDRTQSASFTYGNEGKAASFERISRLNNGAINALAETLGPLEAAIPPPS